MPISPWSDNSQLNPFLINRKVNKLLVKQNENVGIFSTPAKEADKFNKLIEVNDALESELRRYVSKFASRVADTYVPNIEGLAFAGDVSFGSIPNLIKQATRLAKSLKFTTLTPGDIEELQKQYDDLSQFVSVHNDLSSKGDEYDQVSEQSKTFVGEMRQQMKPIEDEIIRVRRGRDQRRLADLERQRDDLVAGIRNIEGQIQDESGRSGPIRNIEGRSRFFMQDLQTYLTILNTKINNFNSSPATNPPVQELKGSGFTIGDQSYYGMRKYNIS
jgi:methyl-accepting chemotaxis protein